MPLSWSIPAPDRSGAEPLYKQLAASLRSSIRQQQKKAAHQAEVDLLLPSERELMERFTLSRMTVRQAIALLASEGWIKTIQGKGSYILPVSADNFDAAHWCVPTKMPLFEPSGMLTAFMDAQAYPATLLYQQRLALDPCEGTSRLRWAKRLHGHIVGLETRHFPLYVTSIHGTALQTDDYMAVLYKDKRTAPLHVELSVRVASASDTEVHALAIDHDMRLLNVDSTLYTKYHKPLMTGNTVYRADTVSLFLKAFCKKS